MNRQDYGHMLFLMFGHEDGEMHPCDLAGDHLPPTERYKTQDIIADSEVRVAYRKMVDGRWSAPIALPAAEGPYDPTVQPVYPKTKNESD